MSSRLSVLSLVALGTLTTLPTADAYDSWPAQPGYHVPVHTGTLTVANNSGGRVNLQVDGQVSRSLAPWQTLSLPLPAGDNRLRVTYTQFGQERLLQSDRVFITPARTSYVTVRSETTARVMVKNGFNVPGYVSVNGKFAAALRPGESRVLSAPIGSATITLAANGATLASTRMTLAAFTEPSFVAEPPPVGDLMVHNPLPIPVELVCDRGMVRTLPAYGRTEYEDIPVGTFHLTARRLSGQRIDEEFATIRRDADLTWRIAPPQTGLVALDSDAPLQVRVRIDDRAVATLSPDENRVIEAELGWHHLDVRDAQGRLVLDTWIDVEPYDVTALSFGQPPRYQAQIGGVHVQVGRGTGVMIDANFDGWAAPSGDDDEIAVYAPGRGAGSGAGAGAGSGAGCALPKQ